MKIIHKPIVTLDFLKRFAKVNGLEKTFATGKGIVIESNIPYERNGVVKIIKTPVNIDWRELKRENKTSLHQIYLNLKLKLIESNTKNNS